MEVIRRSEKAPRKRGICAEIWRQRWKESPVGKGVECVKMPGWTGEWHLEELQGTNLGGVVNNGNVLVMWVQNNAPFLLHNHLGNLHEGNMVTNKDFKTVGQASIHKTARYF